MSAGIQESLQGTIDDLSVQLNGIVTQLNNSGTNKLLLIIASFRLVLTGLYFTPSPPPSCGQHQHCPD